VLHNATSVFHSPSRCLNSLNDGKR
jgi:hypothetical protein